MSAPPPPPPPPPPPFGYGAPVGSPTTPVGGYPPQVQPTQPQTPPPPSMPLSQVTSQDPYGGQYGHYQQPPPPPTMTSPTGYSEPGSPAWAGNNYHAHAATSHHPAQPPPPPQPQTQQGYYQQQQQYQQYQQQQQAPPPQPPPPQGFGAYPSEQSYGGVPQQQGQGQQGQQQYYQQQQGGYQQQPPPPTQQNQQQTVFNPPQAPGQVQNKSLGGSPDAARQGQSTPTGNNSSFGSQGAQGSAATAQAAAARRARPRPAGANRIDSNSVPSPCRDLMLEGPGQPKIRFTTSKGAPPLTVTNFVVVDDGNASPKFIRPTLHSAPYEDSFVRDSGVPWGAVLQPLFDVPEDEKPPLITGRAPVRCHRCRAYINPHVTFVELGRKWQCNFCDMANEVPHDYFSNLDQNGRRRDADTRLEFSRGSVDHDVDGQADYVLKGEKGEIQAQPMHHLFAFDVSKGALESLPDVVESTRATLRQMAVKTPTCPVSFITYGSTLHFYNFSHPSVPQMIVADVDHPFVPLPFSLLCWLKVEDDAEIIETFLDRVLQIASVSNETECALGAVVKVASLILSSTGGKVIVTASKIPSLGIGVIKQPRPVQKLYGTDNEKELYKPIDGFWPQTAIECAKNQISFDLMMFPTDYCELMTLGQICHLTNGLQSCFINYSSAQDQMRLKAALERSLLQTAGYGALLRVRCSPGLRIKQYHGHYLSQDPHDMDLASIHSSSTFYAELTHEAKLDAKGYAYVQCAMLFTTRDGHRRVRVHTLKLSVCSTYAVLFRNSDLEACTIAITHKAIHDAVNKGSKYARDQSNQRLIDLLVAYRKYCSSGSHSGQLLLPEQLKLLPLYNLCLTKSDALVGGTDVRFDERVQSIFDLLTMPTHRVLFYLYPRLYSLRNILSTGHVGLPNPANGEIYLPPVCQLTTDIIMTHGLYALHDQQANTVYLWIGSQISPNVCAQLFGTEDPMLIGLAECPFDQWNERLRNVLISMMKGCGGDHGLDRLVILHERKDPAEEAFFRNMLEDEAVPGGQSYSDLLCAYHKSINARLM